MVKSKDGERPIVFCIAPNLVDALKNDFGRWGEVWKGVAAAAVCQRNIADLDPKLVERLVLDRDPTFRAKVLAAYTDRCAVTGCIERSVLEACHIERYCDNPSSDLHNGLLLRADLHRLFDAKRAWVEKTRSGLVFRVSKAVEDPALRGLNGKAVREPNGVVVCLDRLAEHRLACLRRHNSAPTSSPSPKTPAANEVVAHQRSGVKPPRKAKQAPSR